MKLFVFICNDPDKLDEILEGFLEIGITGATIIDTVGMGYILATEIPIFAGFRSLLSGASSYNKTILSVIKEPEKVHAVFDLIEEVCGSLDKAGAGIAFTVPIDEVRGLMPELE
jgi:nitrogen regulatory protein P-II 1